MDDIESLFSFYNFEEEKKEEKKDKFSLEYIDSTPKSVAVLINLNLGLGLRRSVKDADELLRHTRLIEKFTQKQFYQLEFLDELPCGSYKIFSNQIREQLPVYIFKS